MNDVRICVVNVCDFDLFVGQNLLFEFFWCMDDDLLIVLKVVIFVIGILCM